MGQSAEYWRDYRRRNRERLNAQLAERRRRNGRGDRTAERAAENARRRARHQASRPEPLPMLHPHLKQGTVVEFWDEALRHDIEQEKELALLEGRCPKKAAARYRAENLKFSKAVPLHLLPDEVLEVARPLSQHLGRYPDLGPDSAMADCHEAPAQSHGLCDPCSSWALYMKKRLVRGLVTREQVRVAVLDRLASEPKGRSAWRTHCRQGHPYAGDNLRVRPNGHRICRTCARASRRNSRERLAS